MNFDELLKDKKGRLEELCRRFRVRRLELFGSAARGDFDPETSDVDFLVSFDTPEDGDCFNQYFGLVEELEKLFGRPVELVSESAIRNPYFLEEVNKYRTPLYES